MSTIAEQASSLLDFNKKLDIQLLDNVVGCMYRGQGPQVSNQSLLTLSTHTHLYMSSDWYPPLYSQQQVAQQILTTLKEHPDAWTRVDTILEYSQDDETKYYALQILESVIKTRWKALPRQQCEGQSLSVSLIARSHT